MDIASQSALCGGIEATAKPISFEEAMANVLSAAMMPTSDELIPLTQAFGRVLSSDLHACAPLPRFDHSAMDGFAVRTADFLGNGPWSLTVVRQIVAGEPSLNVPAAPHTAIGVLTGAAVPPDFDSVITSESCSHLPNGDIVIATKPKSGMNIRRTGEDVTMGRMVTQKGCRVTPHIAALLAALGLDKVGVFPKVKVAMFVTGSELRRPRVPLAAGQIYDSNSFMAAATLNNPCIDFTDLGHLPDDFTAITAGLRTAALEHDVIITSGAMSHGAADHMREALKANGAQLSVPQIAMRPGKPATFGRVGRALFIGLPGNPMAAAVALQQIALPAIRLTAGFKTTTSTWFPAVAGFDHEKRTGRTEFIPVSLSGRDQSGQPVLQMLGRGSSGSLLPMATAAGLVRLSAEREKVAPGDLVRFEPFQDM
ncbi:hypothetical protein N185_37315 [Sinorhizobium sp. GW3]|nr:hypothetical protein N185_37315 [Sinorhizobium sp. GW3]